MNENETSTEVMQSWLKENRKLLFWAGVLVLLVSLLYAIKEITTLLFLAYGISLLLDPLVDRLERLKISRSLSLLVLCLLFVLIFVGFIVVAIPLLIREYQDLIVALPDYINRLSLKLEAGLADWVGISGALNLQGLVGEAQLFIQALDIEQLKRMGGSVQSTLLHGYSFALTLLNLTFLPFFVYYIAKDIDQFHRVVAACFPAKIRPKVISISQEIMGHVYSFFKGQITVSCMMAVLYSIGLLIVGLPSAIIVGVIAGLLNIVPYLGVAIGIVLAVIITVVSDFSWMQLLKVGGVFVAVQTLESTFLTPKIVGESVGIHPLGVILALIIGGQLFGLLGLVLAIPVAAAVRVLFQHLKKLVDSDDDTAIVGESSTPVALQE